MNTQNIDKIKLLNSAAKTLSTLVDKYHEKIKEPSCDKYELKLAEMIDFQFFRPKFFLIVIRVITEILHAPHSRMWIAN